MLRSSSSCAMLEDHVWLTCLEVWCPWHHSLQRPEINIRVCIFNQMSLLVRIEEEDDLLEGRLPPVPSRSSIVLHLCYIAHIALSLWCLWYSQVAGNMAVEGNKPPEFIQGEFAVCMSVLLVDCHFPLQKIKHKRRLMLLSRYAAEHLCSLLVLFVGSPISSLYSSSFYLL